MTKDQTTGVFERWLYAAIAFLAARAAARGWIDPSMVDYIAGGGVALVGSLWAWWINRPVALLNAAGNVVPENARLVIETKPQATGEERTAAIKLATAANDKVTAKAG